MKSLKRLKRAVVALLALTLAFAGVGLNAEAASATTVKATIYKAGTNQISIAQTYAQKTAKVVKTGSGYKVTLAFITKRADLGAFPVKIRKIANQTKFSVKKYSKGGLDHYEYTFKLTNLNKKFSGIMRVDINKLDYHHTYPYDVRLAASAAAKAALAKAEKANAKQSAKNSAIVSSAAKKADSSSASSSSTSSTSSTAGSSASTSASSAANSAAVAGSSSKAVAKSTTETSTSKSPSLASLLMQVAGGAVVVCAIGLGGWWLINRGKKDHDEENHTKH